MLGPRLLTEGLTMRRQLKTKECTQPLHWSKSIMLLLSSLKASKDQLSLKISWDLIAMLRAHSLIWINRRRLWWTQHRVHNLKLGLEKTHLSNSHLLLILQNLKRNLWNRTPRLTVPHPKILRLPLARLTTFLVIKPSSQPNLMMVRFKVKLSSNKV